MDRAIISPANNRNNRFAAILLITGPPSRGAG
jgi:hypothetical protein